MRNNNANECAPNNINTLDHWTCFSHSELVSIAIAFNEFSKKHDGRPIDISLPKKALWKEIYNRLLPVCKYEYCWVDLKFINLIKDKTLREHIKYFVFKPKMSKEANSWLNTEDINFVLSQYTAALSYFKFLGAQPSDFYKLLPFDIKQYTAQNFVGLVLNHDKHNQPGSHWVALLVNNVQKKIEYFDSVGAKPPRNICTFIKKLLIHLKGYKYIRNKITHQLKNSECGVYSIYFIIRRILGDSFEELTQTIIRDDQMKTFRKYIFKPN